MIGRNLGRHAQRLCLPLLILALGACQREPASVTTASGSNTNATELMKEFQANVDGVMNSASMKPGSGQAGAPINVSPYVKSAPKHDMNDMHDMHAPDEK